MTIYKNPEHFNVSGDKTVKVTLIFDVDANADDKTIIRDAAWYAKFFADHTSHSSWGRSIEVIDV